MARALDAISLFLIVASLFFLPVSAVAFSQEPALDGIRDFKDYNDAREEDKPFRSSTDISTFTNTKYVFFMPPATMGAWGYARDKSWTHGHFSYSYGYGQSEPRINQSYLQLFSYEKDTTVRIELVNGKAFDATFNHQARAWNFNQSTKVVDFSSKNTGPEDTVKTIEMMAYESVRIQTIGWTLKIDNRIHHYLGGVLRITSDYPITLMHHTMNGKCSNNDEAREHGVTWLGQDGVYSFYGKKLFTWIPADVWISALEGETRVQVIDVTDHSGDATFTLGTFETWCSNRDSIFGQWGFDNSLVLITADKPVSVVAGIEDDNACTQVFGKDQTDFLFPCFGKVMVQAPEKTHIKLEDREGNEGSFEGDLDAGEIRMFDLRVVYTCMETPSYQWARIRSTAPIYVYTIADSCWDDRYPQYKGNIATEEIVQIYNKVSVPYPSGSVPYPLSTSFQIPIKSRAYVVLTNMGEDNNVRVDFSLVNSVYFQGEVEPYGTRVWDISESTSDERQGLDINLDGRAEGGITVNDIRNGTVLKVTADKPVMVLLKYNRDEMYETEAMDLIPGIAPPSPRGLPTPQATIVAMASILMAADVTLVVGGRRAFVDLF
ncbi:MAG: hypothetical protein FJ149_06410 [Euryarchaeota archaeon]|nr:hypothetical protein [Euryarchaeota archaeon]